VTKCANLQEDDQLLASLSLQFLKVAPFSVFFTTTTQTHSVSQSAHTRALLYSWDLTMRPYAAKIRIQKYLLCLSSATTGMIMKARLWGIQTYLVF